MKKHYDFTKAIKVKMHRPAKSLRIPIYLDDDVRQRLTGAHAGKAGDLSQVVNTILRSQIDLAELLK